MFGQSHKSLVMVLQPFGVPASDGRHFTFSFRALVSALNASAHICILFILHGFFFVVISVLSFAFCLSLPLAKWYRQSHTHSDRKITPTPVKWAHKQGRMVRRVASRRSKRFIKPLHISYGKDARIKSLSVKCDLIYVAGMISIH